MLLLVSGATTAIEKFKHKNLGQLLTPQTNNSIDRIVKNNTKWACDNGCYAGFDEVAFLKMVRNIQGKPNLLFVTMPDVVGNSKETLKSFDVWYPIFERYYNVPLAFVLQDGIEISEIPWDKIATVFIGGSTEWKLSKEASEIVQIAKSKGKWVHMGRVNSFKRIRYAYTIGCDSCDGSQFSMFPDTYIPKALEWLSSEQIGMSECFK